VYREGIPPFVYISYSIVGKDGETGLVGKPIVLPIIGQDFWSDKKVFNFVLMIRPETDQNQKNKKLDIIEFSCLINLYNFKQLRFETLQNP
jgi:hypothetical protein